jgi:hypothetical protein
MNIIQRPPLFIGKSAIQNPEITLLDIVQVITSNSFYARPRDNNKHTFIEIRLNNNYISSGDGNLLGIGNSIFIINPTTREKVGADIVKTSLINPTETSLIVRSSDISIVNINTSWKVQLSIGLDITQNLYTCPPPTDLRASFVTQNSVKITWKSGFGSEVNYIRIKQRDEINWSKPYEVPGLLTFLNINNLVADTTYDCQICSSCDINLNNLYSDSISFTTLI